MATSITVTSQAVDDALRQLQHRVVDMTPVLMAIGEDIVERTKQRFATATGPDGAKWRPNTQATIINYLRQRGGFSKKTGKLGARGQKLAVSKRPLQGESGALAMAIFPAVIGNGSGVMVGSTAVYAAMQQFGGTKSQFPQLWGSIPARPFFPITPDGELYPDEADKIVDRIRQYLRS